jgi:hypothetical protein
VRRARTGPLFSGDFWDPGICHGITIWLWLTVRHGSHGPFIDGLPWFTYKKWWFSWLWLTVRHG